MQQEIKLINKNGKHNKFWECKVDETTVTCKWGRLGTKGQSKIYNYSNQWDACEFATTKKHEKMRNDYKEVDENDLNIEKIKSALLGADCKIVNLGFLRKESETLYRFLPKDLKIIANPEYDPLIFCHLKFTGKTGDFQILIDTERAYLLNDIFYYSGQPGSTITIYSKKPIEKGKSKILDKINSKVPSILESLIGV